MPVRLADEWLVAIRPGNDDPAGAPTPEIAIFWKENSPVTAVALADADGNPATSSAAGWQVLAFPTPPVPDYPSARATAGGAGAALIEALVPGRGRPISTMSGSLPGVTRTFATPNDAAVES